MTRNKGKSVCGYKDPRATDDAHGIITATKTTDAATNEGHVLPEVLDAHESNTHQKPDVVAADKQYGNHSRVFEPSKKREHELHESRRMTRKEKKKLNLIFLCNS